MRDLTDDTNWYVVLNQTSDAKSLANFYLNDGTIVHSIWQGTAYAEWDDLKPYIAQIPHDHKFLNWIESAPSDWGMLVSSDAALEEVLAHFRSLTQVWMPSGNHAFFKYYDPDFSIKIARLCADEQRAILMGPCKTWESAETVENTQPRLGVDEKPFPWWSVPAEVISGLSDDSSVLITNLLNGVRDYCQALYEAYPEAVLHKKAERFVAQYQGPEGYYLATFIEFIEQEQQRLGNFL